MVELHASRLRLETASDICGSPAPAPAPAPMEEEGVDGMDEDEGSAAEAGDDAGSPRKRLVARPLVVGHRGASGHRVGNSLESFHHAVALGACVWGLVRRTVVL